MQNLTGGFASGLLGGWLGHNERKSYRNYANNLSNLSQSYNPYMQAGQNAVGQYSSIAGNMARHPANLINQLSSGYENSPYQNTMLKNIAGAMNYNSATTGMLGSTSANAHLQEALAGQQNQFMQNYIRQGMQQQYMGLSGLSDLSHSGLNATGDSNLLQTHAAENRAKAERTPSFLQSIFGGLLGGF